MENLVHKMESLLLTFILENRKTNPRVYVRKLSELVKPVAAEIERIERLEHDMETLKAVLKRSN